MTDFQFSDPALGSAVTQVLGPPPWAPDALLAFAGPLHVLGASDLTELVRLPGLVELTLEGCALPDLASVAGLRDLRVLRLYRCTVVDLSGLRSLPKLTQLEIIGACATEIAPVLDCQLLDSVNLFGLQDQGERLPELMLRPRAGTGRLPTGRVQDSDFGYLTRRTLPLGWAVAEGPAGTTYALRLGPAPRPFVIAVERMAIGQAVREPGVTSDSFARALLERGGHEAPMSGPFGPDIGMARRDEALDRVSTSTLPEADKAWLADFLGRFPEQLAWWEGDVEVDYSVQGKEPPGAWRQYRTTLAMVIPNFFWSVRFRSFQAELPGARREPGPSFYDIAPGGRLGPEDRERFEAEGLYPMGIEPNGGPVLVYDASRPDDRTIWVVSRNEAPLRAAMSPAFASYAALLGHIDAIRLLGEIIVYANDAPEATKG